MKKALLKRVVPVISVILLTMLLLSACNAPDPRIATIYTFSPGPQFATNFNSEDPRRQVRCSVVFEVVDEAAIEELTANTFVVRNAVLSVLGELTMPEVTNERDLADIAQRLVTRVNEDIRSNIDLVVGAYFTDFVLG